MRVLRNLGACLALLLSLVACATTQTGGAQWAGLDADRWGGVLWIKETTRTRQMMAGLTGAQRFAQLYAAINPRTPADRISGVEPGRNGPVTMTIRSGPTVHWRGEGQIDNGIARVRVPAGTRIPSTASLCAVFPTTLGPNNQVSPREDIVARGEEGRTACLDGRIFDYFVNQSRGRRAEDGLAVLGFERS